MNHWHEVFLALFVISVLLLGFIICIAMLIFKKKPIIALLIDITLFLTVVLFIASHSVTFEYNNWAILNNSIYSVEEKYGAFDIGEVEYQKAGSVGYFLYEDNGPIMPDHLPHYYMMDYDESGVVYKVYEALPQGG